MFGDECDQTGEILGVGVQQKRGFIDGIVEDVPEATGEVNELIGDLQIAAHGGPSQFLVVDLQQGMPEVPGLLPLLVNDPLRAEERFQTLEHLGRGKRGEFPCDLDSPLFELVCCRSQVRKLRLR
jgi:hypothetical protein